MPVYMGSRFSLRTGGRTVHWKEDIFANFACDQKRFFCFDNQKWGNITIDFWWFFSFSTKSHPKMINTERNGPKTWKYVFFSFSFFHLLKLFLCTINDPEHQNAPAKWIGDKKLMEVIVMCGKYDNFDPKIGKKVDFFH